MTGGYMGSADYVGYLMQQDYNRVMTINKVAKYTALLSIVIVIVDYLIMMKGLNRIAKREKIKKPSYASIPILNYLLIFKSAFRKNGLTYFLLSLALPVLGNILLLIYLLGATINTGKLKIYSYMISLGGLIFEILLLVALNKIYKRYDKKNSGKYTLLSIFPILKAICINKVGEIAHRQRIIAIKRRKMMRRNPNHQMNQMNQMNQRPMNNHNNRRNVNRNPNMNRQKRREVNYNNSGFDNNISWNDPKFNG